MNNKKAIRAIKEVLKVIEKNGFNISVYEEDDKECGLDIEDWTSGGVDMIRLLDFRYNKNIFNIYHIYEEIKEYSENFDIDEEIDLYREGKNYRDNFTIMQSEKDFEEWQEQLNTLEKQTAKVISKYREILKDEDFENLQIKMEKLIKEI